MGVTLQICVGCMGFVDPSSPCSSLDCPVLYRLHRASRALALVPGLQTLQAQLLDF